LTVQNAIVHAVAELLGCVALLAAQNTAEPGHPEDYPRVDVEYGARIYSEQCDRCHGATGTGVNGVDLKSGKFRSAGTDGQLRNVITRGFPTSGMPPFDLDAASLTGVVAFLRNMNTFDRASVHPGHAGRGQALFEGKGACSGCHRVTGKGSRKAPDLTEIGAVRSAGWIERSLLDPSSQMAPINRPVHIVTRGGRVINGRRLNEDTYTIQITDDEGQLVSLAKQDLSELAISTESRMPSVDGKLTREELADLLAYLLSLKGQ
jgi:putative heme-binding domain-containing protein